MGGCRCKVRVHGTRSHLGAKAGRRRDAQLIVGPLISAVALRQAKAKKERVGRLLVRRLNNRGTGLRSGRYGILLWP